MSPEILALILGAVVVTPITSLIKNPSWSREIKTIICGVASAIAAVVSLAVTGELAFDETFWSNLGQTLPIVFAAATAFYNLKFKNLLVNDKLEETKLL